MMSGAKPIQTSVTENAKEQGPKPVAPGDRCDSHQRRPRRQRIFAETDLREELNMVALNVTSTVH
jgi:hypothetical protein